MLTKTAAKPPMMQQLLTTIRQIASLTARQTATPPLTTTLASSRTQLQPITTAKNTANAIGTGTVATGGSGLNLRASDSAQSNIVGSLNDGASVTIIGESNTLR